jgi:transitional endoplasmic reticulum ATPase
MSTKPRTRKKKAPRPSTALTPTQAKVMADLQKSWGVADVFVLWASHGLGRTTMLRALRDEYGGAWVDMASYLDRLVSSDPMALEETLQQVLLDALRKDDVVLVDDLHLVNDVLCCGQFYPKMNFVKAALEVVCAYAREKKKKLVFTLTGQAPSPIHARAHYEGFKRFEPADFEFFFRLFLGKDAAALDSAKVQRYAPKLNAHQLRIACLELRQKGTFGTDEMITFLRTAHMISNVDIGEVQDVDLSSLKGLDDIVSALEANIILPLEDDALATELNLKPKRGVLIAGPPGTGKTTIGRALARRLRGKFFLIDGTFISGSQQFYARIHQVFEGAKQNAPSVIFIDDSDVIFENGKEHGLYRYLLTALDGLESESAGRVCVMMTAMDVGALPAALVRSGRVELWLETRLPDLDARRSILRDLTSSLPEVFRDLDLERLAVETEGLTGADVKRVVEDGKVLYAFDRSKKLPLRPVTDYFTSAIATVVANKQRYAEAEARIRARPHVPENPFMYIPHFGAEEGEGFGS